MIDQIEDGGRAAAVEEGISQLVFCYAKKRQFLEGCHEVDPALLRIILDLTAHLEVRIRTASDWQRTILTAYKAFRQVLNTHSGILVGDMYRRDLWYEPVPSDSQSTSGRKS